MQMKKKTQKQIACMYMRGFNEINERIRFGDDWTEVAAEL